MVFGQDDVMSLGIKSSAFLRMEDPSWIQEPIVNPGTHRESRNPDTTNFYGKGETGTPPLGEGFGKAWLITGQKFPWKSLKSGSSLLTFRDLSSQICQICMIMGRWEDLHFRKSLFFSGSEFFWPTKYEIWCEMGPYGSVGAHIETGRSPMAQDHFQTPPDPKKVYKNQKMARKDVKAARSAALNF